MNRNRTLTWFIASLSIFFVTCDSIATCLAATPTHVAATLKDPPDSRSVVSNADLQYIGQVGRSEAGLPIGNGRMGTTVWTSPAALHMQINRVDVFAADGSCDYPVDYCGGCARIDINLGPDVFPADSVRQHLSVYDGLVTIDGNGVTLKIIAWPEKDVIAVNITDNRPMPHEVQVDLGALRPTLVRNRTHYARSKFSSYPAGAVLSQRFEQRDYLCRSSTAVQFSSGKPTEAQHDATTKRITVVGSKNPQTIWIGSAATFDDTTQLQQVARQLCQSANDLGFSAIQEATSKWWHNFWSRSHIDLHSADGAAEKIETAYTYYLYVMASTSRGKYPPKFNGLLFSTAGDRRRWGSYFWWWNTQTLYLAPLTANHPELMAPMFDMYSGAYEAAARAAQQQWGCQGIFFPETMPFNGLEEMPTEVAGDLRDFLLERKLWEQTSETFKRHAEQRVGFSSRWNFIHSRETAPHSWITHIFFSQAQVAWHFWRKYQFTQDKEWLRQRAYPMLKGVAEFYRTYPNLKKGDDGLYHIHNVNNGEGLWGGQDTNRELSAMMGILPTAIRASEILDVDPELRSRWQQLLDNLAPLPTSKHPDAAFPARTRDAAVWTPGLKPLKHTNWPRPGFQPITHFDLVTLETPPSPLTRIAADTYRAFKKPITWSDNPAEVHILTLAGITAANMGDAENVQEIIQKQISREGADTEKLLPNRMSLEEGHQAQTIEHLGLGARTLQLALCQSRAPHPGGEPVIRIFPAWPADWDADFSLLCRGGFMVRGNHTDGAPRFVHITSTLGGPLKLRNPWTDKPAEVLHNRSQQLAPSALLEIETKKGDVITLSPVETSPVETGENEGQKD